MEIGIIGLPQSGKTTVLNSLVHGAAATGSHGPGGKGNVGVTRVADPRLEELTRLYQPERVVPAEVRYLDPPRPHPPARAIAKASGGSISCRPARWMPSSTSSAPSRTTPSPT